MTGAASLYNEDARTRQNMPTLNDSWSPLPIEARQAGMALQQLGAAIGSHTSGLAITPKALRALSDNLGAAETQLKILRRAIRGMS